MISEIKEPLRMPAEWEPHDGTWLAWPHQQEDWPGKHACIPWVYLEIIRHLHASEKVFILVSDEAMEDAACEVLGQQKLDLTQIELVQVPTDRAWTRDYCPIFVHDAEGEVVATNWHFNGWAKYDNWVNDNAVPLKLFKRFRWPNIVPAHNGRQVVLEGGSIDVNGQGLMLTTEECLLSPIQARNPDLTRQDLEAVFARVLGCDKVLWLGRGVEGDDTHGHVDDLARFVNERTVVTVIEENREDPNYDPLQDNLQRLKGMTDQHGKSLEVVTLPMPEPVFFSGQRLPASYANFYIANKVVLMPTFNDINDRRALGILEELFPTRKVVGIHAIDLVWGLGTLHCMTQQQPAPKNAARDHG